MIASDYSRIASAIEYLGEHKEEQPPLADVARAVGLSEFHFQRLFRRWAGISPKRFLQFLTAQHAQSLLRDGVNVLDAAYETGLSGPGRLHDLMVNVYAATPGELRNGGSGVTIRYGTHASPFGQCLIAATDRGVCWLAFVEQGSVDGELARLRRSWPSATLRHDPKATAPLAGKAFNRGRGPLTLDLKGTNFQLRVWEALLRIPPAAVCCYEEVASAIGRPEAARAVASAVARNPVGFLIPCHRVIQKTGALGGYRWGTARKQAMLAWESARASQVSQRPAIAAAHFSRSRRSSSLNAFGCALST